MSFRGSRSLRSLLAIGLLIFSSVVGIAQSQTDNREMTGLAKEAVLASMEKVLTTSAFVPGVDFKQWPDLLKKHRESLAAAKTELEFTNVVNRALMEYGFSHISLFPPSFGQQRMTQTRAGIGIRIQIEDGGLRVTDVFPDGPASKAGIQPGDLVVESDGKPVKAPVDLSGEKGQTSKVVVDREGQKLTFTITRDEYKTVIPESIKWEGDYAVVKIPTFDIGYDRANIDKIMKEARRAKGIILDLRSNGGGRVINMQHLAGYFFDPEQEPLGTFIGKNTVAAFEKENGRQAKNLLEIAEFTKAKVRGVKPADGVYTGRVAVLINGGSGSASEIMAAALREHKGAQLIGSPSAGAVLASLMLPLQGGEGFWIQYPVTDYVTFKGLRIEGTGLQPDQAAPIPRFGAPDEAVKLAINWLSAAR